MRMRWRPEGAGALAAAFGAVIGSGAEIVAAVGALAVFQAEEVLSLQKMRKESACALDEFNDADEQEHFEEDAEAPEEQNSENADDEIELGCEQVHHESLQEVDEL